MRLITLSFIFTLFTLFSCSSDDDKNSDDDSLVGSWKIYERGFSEDFGENYEWSQIDETCLSFVFRSDNTFTAYNLNRPEECNESITIGTWLIVENVLNLYYEPNQGPEQLEPEIMSLNSNTLELKYEYENFPIVIIHKFNRV